MLMNDQPMIPLCVSACVMWAFLWGPCDVCVCVSEGQQCGLQLLTAAYLINHPVSASVRERETVEREKELN